MKNHIIILFLSIALLGSCNSPARKQECIAVNPDSLISKIDRYIDSRVVVEGEIVHVCGVTGTKMKLRSENGANIKISPIDSLIKYDTVYYKKRIRVTGTVKESRILPESINKIENEKILLCHIDRTPCKDTIWSRNQIEKGISDSLCIRDVDKLRNTMTHTGKNYVSIITIIADTIVILNRAQ